MQALIPVMNGFRAMELATITNILKSAGIDVTIVGVVSSVVESEEEIRIVTEKRITEIDPNKFDILILVGGNPGFKNLQNSGRIINLIKLFDEKRKLIVAISESPIVLAKAGVLKERIATCSPSLEKHLPKPRSYKIVRDSHIITARDSSSVALLGLKIVERLMGKNKMINVKDKIGL